MIILVKYNYTSSLQAEVCGSGHADDENRTEFQLKQYDYFGHGAVQIIVFIIYVYFHFSNSNT